MNRTLQTPDGRPLSLGICHCQKPHPRPHCADTCQDDTCEHEDPCDCWCHAQRYHNAKKPALPDLTPATWRVFLACSRLGPKGVWTDDFQQAESLGLVTVIQHKQGGARLCQLTEFGQAVAKVAFQGEGPECKHCLLPAYPTRVKLPNQRIARLYLCGDCAGSYQSP